MLKILKKIAAEAKARETSWFVTNFSVNLKETTMVWRILSWIKTLWKHTNKITLVENQVEKMQKDVNICL